MNFNNLLKFLSKLQFTIFHFQIDGAGAPFSRAVPAAAGNTGGEADLHGPNVPAGRVGLPLQLKCLKVWDLLLVGGHVHACNTQEQVRLGEGK